MRYLLLCFALTSASAFAQDVKEDYRAFRESLMKDYQGFRQQTLDNYSGFLEGVWKEFQTFRGEKRDVTPKPVTIPPFEESPAGSTPQQLPAPEVRPLQPKSSVPTVPEVKPVQPVKPVALQVTPRFSFLFYGIPLKAAPMQLIPLSELDGKQIAQVWRAYQKSDEAEVALESLSTLSVEMGLNDWFTIELIRAYVDRLGAHAQAQDRIILQQYLMANLGYDIRLGKAAKQLVLLMPFRQLMYERSYLPMEGIRYYVFFDSQWQGEQNPGALATYEVPKEADSGEAVELRFNRDAMRITTEEVVERTISDDRLQVSVSVNRCLMEMLRHYPQMDIPSYAASVVLPPLHQEILEQLKPQIAGLSEKEATQALLHFVQYAFDYATDGEQHGYEKPYFLEENFYYPKNDCEDRAIFFAFLVHHLLGLDVHLVQFPGHECTAVHFTDETITGDGYTYNGKRFLICDPTFIGASIGRCMPSYTQTQPKVEIWY